MPHPHQLLLEATPKLMYNTTKRLVLLWSPKCGCTFAVKWFLYQTGELARAEAAFTWIHDYRSKIFYNTRRYWAEASQILEPDFRVVKFVRNPYDRAVSSFLFLLKTAAVRPQRGSEIYQALGLKPGQPVSFEDFLSILSAAEQNLHSNPHFTPQIHPLETADLLSAVNIIKLEDSLNALPLLEKKLGLRESHHEAFRFSKHHNAARLAGSHYCGNVAYVPRADALFPPNESFYNEKTRSIVAGLYAADFAAYGYPV